MASNNGCASVDVSGFSVSLSINKLIDVSVSQRAMTIYWQEGAEGNDCLRSVTVLEDGSIIAGGYASGTWNNESVIGSNDLAAVKLHSNGTLAWRWSVSMVGRYRGLIPKTPVLQITRSY